VYSYLIKLERKFNIESDIDSITFCLLTGFAGIGEGVITGSPATLYRLLKVLNCSIYSLSFRGVLAREFVKK
jgi:hypothetical protein